MQLNSDAAKFQRLAARPTFVSSYQINERLVNITVKPNVIVCDKPIYVGASILDLSTVHMYSFYYDHLM